MALLKKFRRAFNLLLLIGGIVLSLYGVVELISLDHIAIGKFDPDGRDSGSVMLLIAIGVCAALYGLVSLTLDE